MDLLPAILILGLFCSVGALVWVARSPGTTRPAIKKELAQSIETQSTTEPKVADKKPAWKKPISSWSITRDVVIILLLAYIGFCLSGVQTVDVGNTRDFRFR